MKKTLRKILLVIVISTLPCNLYSNTIQTIIIEKSNNTMKLLDENNSLVKEYSVRLGRNHGPKHCNGDMKTPEGVYSIIEKRSSKYGKFLAIDYPNYYDKKLAKKLKCKPGDSIGIHAWINTLPREGSQGCITVWTKKEILEINRLVSVGTKVIIKP